MTQSTDHFPTDPSGLPPVHSPPTVDLGNGDRFQIRIAPVAKRLEGGLVRMLAYNESIPGPTLRVHEGDEITIEARNEGDLEATIHWHGLRLDNRFDGTAETQEPMPVGGNFTYRLAFPDPGVYWYHPHIREDYAQEMGLYGTIIVAPKQPDYWPPVNRELSLTLDDLLLEEGKVAPFRKSQSSYTAMGRFGNVLLVNGEPQPELRAHCGEVVRFYFTDTANTRVFNLCLPGARMKLVGGDSGHYEHEQFIENVVIAPSERVVVDVYFERPGKLTLQHRTPHRTYELATIWVEDRKVEASYAREFELLRANADMAAERLRCANHLARDPDKTLALVAEMDMGEPHVAPGGSVTYYCPMHPDVESEAQGRCPKCGMKLLAKAAAPMAYVCPMHPDVRSEKPDRCPQCGMKLVPAQLVSQPSHEAHGGHGHDPHHDHGSHGDNAAPGNGGNCGQVPSGIEWEDDMVEVNRITTPDNTRWKLLDRATGATGSAIDWRFRVGDQVKIRLVNEMDSDHPMHHPFHVHGAGRFLVLARDGIVESNLVWKDTVLIPTGQTVDILLDVTNPGLWMAHCHIAEHHESGMMFSFRVDP